MTNKDKFYPLYISLIVFAVAIALRSAAFYLPESVFRIAGTFSSTTPTSTPAKLVVLSPSGGDKLFKGMVYKVSWYYPLGGKNTTKHSFILSRGTTDVENFFVPNTNGAETSFEWKVPNSTRIDPASNYNIKIMAQDSNGSLVASDSVDTPFTILEAPTASTTAVLKISRSGTTARSRKVARGMSNFKFLTVELSATSTDASISELIFFSDSVNAVYNMRNIRLYVDGNPWGPVLPQLLYDSLTKKMTARFDLGSSPINFAQWSSKVISVAADIGNDASGNGRLNLSGLTFANPTKVIGSLLPILGNTMSFVAK